MNLTQRLAAKTGARQMRRALVDRARQHKSNFTPQEKPRIAEPNANTKVSYDVALTEAMSARNFASETGTPLRLADPGSNTRGGSVSQAADEMPTPGTLPSETGMPSTSSSSTSGGNVMRGTSTQTVSPHAGHFNAPTADLVATVDGQRAQIVLHGAERISTAELLRRRQGQPGTQRQQSGRAGTVPASDLALFGNQRNRGSLFDVAVQSLAS